MKFLTYTFIFIQLSFSSSLLAQELQKGTDFWFTLPPANDLGTLNSDYFQATINIHSDLNIPVHVLIESGTELIHDVIYGSGQSIPDTIYLPREYSLQRESETIEEYGIHVTTSSEVTVNVAVSITMIGSEDLALITPTPNLGKEYVAITTPGVRVVYQGFEDMERPHLSICATEDDTQITIIPNFISEKGAPAGVPIIINLNRGQSYEIRPDDPYDQISGTKVRACKPIAVFSGTQGVYYSPDLEGTICCTDRVWDQIMPTKYWGTKFYTAPFESPRDNVKGTYGLKIIALNNDTEFFIDGNSKGILESGDVFHIKDLDFEKVIEASKPIQVAKFMYSGGALGPWLNSTTGLLGDASMFPIAPIDAQTTETYITKHKLGIVSANIEGYFMATIILRTEDIEHLTFTPNLETVYFDEFSYDPDYSYAIIYLNEDIDDLEISNPNGFQAYSYYLGQAVGYGVNAPFILSPENLVKFDIPDNICINEILELNIRNTTFKNEMEYEWDFGNGDFDTGAFVEYSYSDTGSYHLKVTGYLNDCETFSYTDSISIFGSKTPDFIITGTSQVFPYDTLTYEVPILETSTLNWEVLGGEIISIQNNQITVAWNNREELGTVQAVEITEEGCIGSQYKLDINIESFNNGRNECLAYSSIYPNPVLEVLSLKTYINNDDVYDLRIFNALGQLMDTQTKSLQEGRNYLEFNVKDYPADVYFISFTTETCTSTVKWIKLR
jgi:hypothetical protein